MIFCLFVLELLQNDEAYCGMVFRGPPTLAPRDIVSEEKLMWWNLMDKNTDFRSQTSAEYFLEAGYAVLFLWVTYSCIFFQMYKSS